MERDNITLLCYWNGRIISGPRSISYEGATPKAVKVCSSLNYLDLMDKMYDVTGFDRQHMRIKITCRYPSNFHDYIGLPVEDDDTLNIVFDVTKRPEINCLEFYLETITEIIHEPTNVPVVISNGPFTQLLTQGTGLFDHDFNLTRDVFNDEQSDRHIGIQNVMNTYGSGWTEPHAYHRFCIRHLASNFNTKFHDKTLKNLLWWTANENQIRKFDIRMEAIEKINPEARKWLDQIPKEKWALAHDGGHRYGIMTTNLSEVFNSVLKGARCLPITALVQLTFYRVNSYFAIRRQLGAERVASGQNFTPFVDAKISSNGVKASRHEVVLFNRSTGTFSIRTGRSATNIRKRNNVQVVKLKEQFCSCQKWQFFGFPCSHVMAACQSCCLDYTTLVQKWYSIATYQLTWEPLFHPIPDQAYWPSPTGMILMPSDSMKRTSKGRPKSTRLHNEMDIKEGRGTIRCSNGKEGHNKKKCKKQN